MAEIETLNVQESVTQTSPEITEAQKAEAAERRAKNVANLKKHASMHGMAVVAALTLFGAAHTWAAASGWPIALGTGIAAAFVAGMLLSSIFHEWGHYSGAALADSTIKIADETSGFTFFLGFNPKKNSTRQALWLTWGGIIGSWSIVVAVALLVPMNSWISAVLLATLAGRAVNASYFEVPIAWRTHHGYDFKSALKERLASPGTVNVPGLIAGLALLTVLT